MSKRTTAKTTKTSPDVQQIPLDKIDAGTNARTEFDNEALHKLASSLEAKGLIQPVVVRPIENRYSIVCGERRVRAARMLQWNSIAARVVELDDREAMELGLLENLDREDLNPIEQAGALKLLMDLGHDRPSLAKLTRLTEGTVEGRLSLLRLPEAWAERIRKGRLSPAAGERLVPYVAFPKVLEGMERHADNCWPLPLTEWRSRIVHTVLSLSRAMDPDAADAPRFEVTEDRRSKLDVVVVELRPGKVVERAMNVDLWDRLADDHDAEIAREREQAPPMIPAPRPEPAPSARRQSADDDQAPPPDLAAGDRHAGAVSGGARELQKHVRDFKAAWLRRICRERLERLDLPALQEAAALLGVDPAAEWALDNAFLDLFHGRALTDLADELHVDVAAAADEPEVRAMLKYAAPEQIPRCVAECA